MRLRLVISVLIAMLTVIVVSGCGNKGELYRIPDEIREKDLNVLEEVLDEIDAQTLESKEIDGLNNLSQEELDKLKAKKPGK